MNRRLYRLFAVYKMFTMGIRGSYRMAKNQPDPFGDSPMTLLRFYRRYGRQGHTGDKDDEFHRMFYQGVVREITRRNRP